MTALDSRGQRSR